MSNFEYEVKSSRAGLGMRYVTIGAVLRGVERILKDREQGMGAGKITITQRRVEKEGGEK